MSGPVKNGALGPACPAGALLRVRGFLLWAAGTLASGSVAVPCPAKRTGFTGRRTCSGKGSASLQVARAVVGAGQGDPSARAGAQCALRQGSSLRPRLSCARLRGHLRWARFSAAIRPESVRP